MSIFLVFIVSVIFAAIMLVLIYRTKEIKQSVDLLETITRINGGMELSEFNEKVVLAKKKAERAFGLDFNKKKWEYINIPYLSFLKELKAKFNVGIEGTSSTFYSDNEVMYFQEVLRVYYEGAVVWLVVDVSRNNIKDLDQTSDRYKKYITSDSVIKDKDREAYYYFSIRNITMLYNVMGNFKAETVERLLMSLQIPYAERVKTQESVEVYFIQTDPHNQFFCTEEPFYIKDFLTDPESLKLLYPTFPVQLEGKDVMVSPDKLIEGVAAALVNKQNVFIHGHPNSGKTALAKIVAKIVTEKYKRPVYIVSHFGEELIGKFMAYCRSLPKGSVLIMDDFGHYLATSKDTPHSIMLKTLTDSFNSAASGSAILITSNASEEEITEHLGIIRSNRMHIKVEAAKIVTSQAILLANKLNDLFKDSKEIYYDIISFNQFIQGKEEVYSGEVFQFKKSRVVYETFGLIEDQEIQNTKEHEEVLELKDIPNIPKILEEKPNSSTSSNSSSNSSKAKPKLSFPNKGKGRRR